MKLRDRIYEFALLLGILVLLFIAAITPYLIKDNSGILFIEISCIVICFLFTLKVDKIIKKRIENEQHE
jgi:uncharacterized membrane protein YhdT